MNGEEIGWKVEVKYLGIMLDKETFVEQTAQLQCL